MSGGHRFSLLLWVLFPAVESLPKDGVDSQHRRSLQGLSRALPGAPLEQLPWQGWGYPVGQSATTAMAMSSSTITTSIPAGDTTRVSLLPSAFTNGFLGLNPSLSQLGRIPPAGPTVMA